MALATNNFTTGPSVLPDIGTLNYNGCTFSPLFASSISGNVVKDEARRTTKYTEIILTVDGYVTLEAGAEEISPTMANLHRLLTAQGGSLTYTGRGFDLVINRGGGGGGLGKARPVGDASSDVAWGPVPELLEFQPMGGGLSAKVRWRVTVRVPAVKAGKSQPLLQFNYETSVSYGEDYYCTLSMRGTLEIPMTRATQGTRTIPVTADSFRDEVQRRLLGGIDLGVFRITRREFTTSRDKRTLSWDIAAEEKPWMDLPPRCAVARGTYDVRPARTGAALATWLCTLRATYTLNQNAPRRQAHLLFLALMRLRMFEAINCNVPGMRNGDQQGVRAGVAGAVRGAAERAGAILTGSRGLFRPAAASAGQAGLRAAQSPISLTFLDFSISEGIYLDSKTITFSATWRINTTWSHIMLASGIWTKLKEEIVPGQNLWAATARGISGASSWLTGVDRVDPKFDVIVDFGSTD